MPTTQSILSRSKRENRVSSTLSTLRHIHGVRDDAAYVARAVASLLISSSEKLVTPGKHLLACHAREDAVSVESLYLENWIRL